MAAGLLRTISSVDPGAAAIMLGFPWIIDGIDPSELSAISPVGCIVDQDLELARAVLDLWWVTDNMPPIQAHALQDICDLSQHNLELAWQAIGEPFMGPPFRYRDEYALNTLAWLARWEPPLLAQLASQPWFSDGLNDLEAALVYVITDSNHDFQQALMETHYVASIPIMLPFTGDVELVVVRHTPFPSDDHTFATLEEGVRAIEMFMGAPLLTREVILLLPEPDLWSLPVAGKRVGRSGSSDREGGIPTDYEIAHMVVNNSEVGPSKNTLYHEIGHYYFLYGAEWLSEGGANFFAAYIRDQVGIEGLEQRLAHLETSEGCSEENIQQYYGYHGEFYCLGERFLLAMYAGLGQEVVSAALRDLHTQSLLAVFLNENTVYETLLANIPAGKEEVFKSIYRRYHGGPSVDATLENSLDWAPLVALYNATEGAGWSSNGNWLSRMLLGTWHGVTTNPLGRVYIVRLGNNQLNGEIPSELGNLTNLWVLDLTQNQLRGKIPPELGNLSSLTLLDLKRNQLTGEIPPELTDLTNLQNLSLSGNRLGGEIPSELGELSDLTWLDLGGNRLIGAIPPELGKLSNLGTLRLWDNRLSGSIPAELGNLTILDSLELSNNQLSGEIPPELGDLAELNVLDIDGNQLSGEIPSELGNFTNPYRLDLSRNNLSGQIPPELGNLGGINTLDLSMNQLSGEIPTELGSLSNLEKLFLGGNQFSGCIPEELGDIPENDLDELGLPFCGASGSPS